METYQLQIAWSKAYDGDGPIAGYVIQIKKVDGDWTSVGFVDSQATLLKYTVTCLTANTTYTVRVKILSGGSCNGGSYLDGGVHPALTITTKPARKLKSEIHYDIVWVKSNDVDISNFLAKCENPNSPLKYISN